MQMSYCLYWCFLVDLAYLKESVGFIHAKEMSFSTKRKVVKDN